MKAKREQVENKLMIIKLFANNCKRDLMIIKLFSLKFHKLK
jgi:hypothetical protein